MENEKYCINDFKVGDVAFDTAFAEIRNKKLFDEFGNYVENEKIKQIENLISNVMAKNFCEYDEKTYIDYLYADLKRLQVVLAIKQENKQDTTLIENCIEEIILLQEIILKVKNIEG